MILLIRTNLAKDTIFLGNKHDTISSLKFMLMKKTQQCDYIEHVLELVTSKYTSNIDSRLKIQISMNQNSFFFNMKFSFATILNWVFLLFLFQWNKKIHINRNYTVFTPDIPTTQQWMWISEYLTRESDTIRNWI